MNTDLKELFSRSMWFFAGIFCAILFCAKTMLLFTDLPGVPQIIRVTFLIEGIALVYPTVYSFRKCMSSTTEKE